MVADLAAEYWRNLPVDMCCECWIRGGNAWFMVKTTIPDNSRLTFARAMLQSRRLYLLSAVLVYEFFLPWSSCGFIGCA